MQRPNAFIGGVYHIFNRGVDKRDIFLDDFDRLRFIHDLYEFNDSSPAADSHTKSKFAKQQEVGLPVIKDKGRDKIVEILAFCLMDNHFHLMIKEIKEGGITMFMRKVGSGYTNYFNNKNKRSGSLFQGKFKIVQVVKEPHFLFLPYYIHLNPLDLEFYDKEKAKIKNEEEMISFIENYRWSSLLDYIGKKNFPSLIDKGFLKNILGDENKQKSEMVGWVRNFNKITENKDEKHIFLD